MKKNKTVTKKPVKKKIVKKAKPARDIEKTYSRVEFVEKLVRFADAILSGKGFTIQIAGEKIKVPKNAKFNIEHEREGKSQEIEFQVKW